MSWPQAQTFFCPNHVSFRSLSFDPSIASDDSVQLCEKKIIFRPSIPLPDYSEMLEQNKSEQDLIPQENETNVAQL